MFSIPPYFLNSDGRFLKSKRVAIDLGSVEFELDDHGVIHRWQRSTPM